MSWARDAKSVTVWLDPKGKGMAPQWGDDEFVNRVVARDFDHFLYWQEVVKLQNTLVPPAGAVNWDTGDWSLAPPVFSLTGMPTIGEPVRFEEYGFAEVDCFA